VQEERGDRTDPRPVGMMQWMMFSAMIKAKKDLIHKE
jgi:hypothetical protein